MAEIRTRIYGSLMNTNGTLVTSGKLYITLPQEFVNVEGNRVAPYVYEYTITGSLDFYLYATTNSVGGTIYAAPSPASVSYIIELDPTPTDTTVIRSRKSGYFKLTTTIPHISDTPGSNQTTFGSLTSSTTVANYNYAALGDTRFLTQAQRDALTNGSNADAYHIHVNVSNLAVTDNGGLNIAYAAGVVEKRDIGAGTLTSYSISASTLAMTDSTTNYVYVDSTDGVVKKKGTAFTSADISLATVVTSGGDITSVTDKRALLGAFGLTTPVSVASGGTGTATGSITGTSALTFTAGGSNQNVTLTPSGSGYTLLNGNVGIGTTSPGNKLDISGSVGSDGSVRIGNTNTNSGGYADLFLFNDGGSYFGYQMAGSAVTGTSWGVARAGMSKIVSSGTSILIGTEAVSPIIFGINSVEKVRIDTNGNVGIGTTAPDCKLDFGTSAINAKIVVGTYMAGASGIWTGIGMGASTAGVRIAGDAVGNNILDIGSYSVDASHNWTSRVFVDGSGNVGIGTTNPGYKLEVLNEVAAKGAGVNIYAISTGADSNARFWTQNDAVNWAFGVRGDSSDSWIMSNNSTGGWVDNLTILKSGNVGIGTTGPASLTEIQGGLTTVGAVLTLGSKETSTVVNDVLGRINFYAPLDAAGTDAILVAGSIAAVAEGSFSATSNATSLIFQTGASEVATTKMTISSAGLVTVASASYGGTPYSGTKLLIGGDSGTSALTIGAPANQASSIYFADPDSGIIGRIDYTHTDNKMAIVTNGSEAIGIASTGLVTISSGLVVSASGITSTGSVIHHTLDSASTGTALIIDGSDIIRPLTSAERYKENIRRDWQTDTEAFFALSPILFDYKNGGAQDVLSFSADKSMALPHLVNLNSDGLPESLREHAFIAYLFNSAKADHARIAELERKLKLLLEVSKCEDS